MAEFRNYCRKNNVDVFAYGGAPQAACTIRDGQDYCVIIDFTKVTSTRELRGILMHEQGHLSTGALHKCLSPYQICQQSEYRADGWSFKQYLSPGQFKEAFQAGYTEPWQLADYFDLPEKTIRKALHYWTECRGINLSSAS
jgi:hypothetical protein